MNDLQLMCPEKKKIQKIRLESLNRTAFLSSETILPELCSNCNASAKLFFFLRSPPDLKFPVNTTSGHLKRTECFWCWFISKNFNYPTRCHSRCVKPLKLWSTHVFLISALSLSLSLSTKQLYLIWKAPPERRRGEEKSVVALGLAGGIISGV